MANGKNLIPNSQRTPEQRRANGQKGGKASGESRKRRRRTQEVIKTVLAMKPPTSRKIKSALNKVGYDAETDGELTVELLMNIAIAGQAMSGDLASAKFLYDYAQVPDLKAQLERERVKAAREQASKPASMDVEDLSPLVRLLSDPPEEGGAT